MNRQIFPVNYAPYVQHEGLSFKYGVVQHSVLVKDLLHWRWLVLAGRLHKPVVFLGEQDAQFAQAY